MSKADLFRKMRKNKFFMIGSFMLLILLFSVIVGPMLIPFDPRGVNLQMRLTAPEWFSKGLNGHILGTNGAGSDMLARMLAGGRVSLSIALAGIILPSIIGTVLGMSAGYFGGWVDMAVMRATEILNSIPYMLMAIAIMAVLGANVYNLLITMTIGGWISYARLARMRVLTLRRSEFVLASGLLGGSQSHIMFSQILPNCYIPLIINASQQIGNVILIEASLSFLGCGVPITTPTWGSMISDGRGYLTTAPWTVIVPGLALMYTVLTFSLLGEGIRDVLDPKNKD